MDKLKEYSGDRWSIALLSQHLAETMRSNSINEAEVYIPAEHGDVTIRMKRENT